MDTREKIVPLGDLPARLGTAPVDRVVGRFDPLTLAQAERVAKLNGEGRSILIVVEPGVGLPAAGRSARGFVGSAAWRAIGRDWRSRIAAGACANGDCCR